MMVLVYSLVMFGMQNNFDLCLQHIPRVNNSIANALSRFNNDEFQQLTLTQTLEFQQLTLTQTLA